jgi:hypothetical protein
MNGFAILTYRVGDTKMSSKVKKIDGDKSRKLLNGGSRFKNIKHPIVTTILISYFYPHDSSDRKLS